MAVPRPDAHLHQAAREPLLHDAGEGAGVGEAVALELVVQVGMGVDVEDRQPGVPSPDGPQDRVRHRVIAADGDWGAAVIHQPADCALYRRDSVSGIRHADVAGIAKLPGRGEINPELGPHVGRRREERLAHERRGRRRAAQEGRVRVPRNADERRALACHRHILCAAQRNPHGRTWVPTSASVRAGRCSENLCGGRCMMPITRIFGRNRDHEETNNS